MKVSIIIPAYNEEKYIGKCIETLLNQSYRDFEIIIIDDGSKDRTVEIVKKLSSKNKKIKLLSQNHGGPGRARNLGAKHTKGGIIVLVDADMEFDKNYIKNLVKPIVEGREIGTYHIKEYAANKKNIWARCWGTKRVEEKPGKTQPIFRAILKKEFLSVGGFDPAKGTFDDQSLAKKLGKEAIGVDATCYHNNPTSLPETFNHSKWIGGSFMTNKDAIKRHIKKFSKFIFPAILIFAVALIFLIFYRLLLFTIILVLLSPVILAILLAIRRILKSPDPVLFFALIIFFLVFIFGFAAGGIKQFINVLASRMKGEKISYKY